MMYNQDMEHDPDEPFLTENGEDLLNDMEQHLLYCVEMWEDREGNHVKKISELYGKLDFVNFLKIHDTISKKKDGEKIAKFIFKSINSSKNRKGKID